MSKILRQNIDMLFYTGKNKGRLLMMNCLILKMVTPFIHTNDNE